MIISVMTVLTGVMVRMTAMMRVMNKDVKHCTGRMGIKMPTQRIFHQVPLMMMFQKNYQVYQTSL